MEPASWLAFLIFLAVVLGSGLYQNSQKFRQRLLLATVAPYWHFCHRANR